MSYSQAKARFHSHVWWHTDRHCWDNQRRAAGDYDDPDPIEKPSPAKAELAVDQATAAVHTTVYFPALEVNAWPPALLPMGHSDMSRWPLIFDVDRPTAFERWRDRVSGTFK